MHVWRVGSLQVRFFYSSIIYTNIFAFSAILASQSQTAWTACLMSTNVTGYHSIARNDDFTSHVLHNSIPSLGYATPSSTTPIHSSGAHHPSPTPSQYSRQYLGNESVSRARSASPTNSRNTPLGASSNPSTRLSVPDWNKPIHHFTLMTIDTKYDPNNKINKNVMDYTKSTSGELDHNDAVTQCDTVTQEERQFAKNAINAKSLGDFETKVCFYNITIIIILRVYFSCKISSKPEREQASQSILDFLMKFLMGKLYNFFQVLSLLIFYRQMLRINDKNKNLMAIILPNMPKNLRCNLLKDLGTLYPNLAYIDTATEPERIKESFVATHFSYYNRYSNKASICD